MRVAGGLAILVALGLALVAGCERDNPANCRSDRECGLGRCRDYRCETVTIPDGGATRDAADAADAPDAPGAMAPLDARGCKTNGDCVGQAGGVCDPASGRCVACVAAADCAEPGKPVCLGNACVPCGAAPADACGKRDPARRACEGATGRCVGCLVAADCGDPAKPLCAMNVCVGCAAQGVPADGCAKKAAANPVCEPASGACVECATSADCGDGKRPICAGNRCVPCQEGGTGACGKRDPKRPACLAATGACVECTTSAECTDPTRPICGPGQTCTACTADAQCVAKAGPNPGVCLSHQDGRCATEAEAIFVENRQGCSMGAGAGTSGIPFCQPQAAAAALGPARRLVVLRGPKPVSVFSGSFAAGQVTIVGQNGAKIEPGADVGLRLVEGDFFVRDLTIGGGSGIGVVAESAATLRLQRAVVEGNGGGGIQLNGAAFDIANTVIAANGPGFSGLASWGGLIVVLPPAGKLARFIHNTVVRNNGGGLSCSGPLGASGLIAFGTMNAVADVTPACAIAPCCTGDPLLSPSHRLMSGSPCIDKVDPMMSLPDDIDGEPRPQGARSDCGADELR